MSEVSTRSRDGEFYVGYLRTPSRLRRFALCVACVLTVVVLAIAAVVAGGMRDPGDGRWELGEAVVVNGRLQERPYPMLDVPGADGRIVMVLLVGEGKVGFADRVAGMDGQLVRVSGHWVRRGRLKLLEVLTIESEVSDLNPTHAGTAAAAKRLTLAGEIIDPKCYAGAMKPGDGKVHKACAALCIRGGIPAMLVVKGDGGDTFYLLANERGEALRGLELERVAQYAGEVVEAAGFVATVGDLMVLRLDIGALRRR